MGRDMALGLGCGSLLLDDEFSWHSDSLLVGNDNIVFLIEPVHSLKYHEIVFTSECSLTIWFIGFIALRHMRSRRVIVRAPAFA
jgi:hypothetical protein